MLLTPVAGQIQGKRLLIVGDDALQYIPFAALPSPESISAKVPLIAGHEIVNLPSASILALLRREAPSRKAASKTLMVMADPVFGSHDDRLHGSLRTVEVSVNPYEIADQFSLDRSAREVGAAHDRIFPRLPFSRLEAEAIYATASLGEATKALDFDASKAMAMSKELGKYKIVHFATHGLVNSEHPALSGLVFSLIDRQGRSQDGFLRLSDMYNLELNADLVVLSACQTALGKQIKGEGLIGITRGLMYAGSPRVIASLWKIEDRATAELMKKFYEALLKKDQRPADALRSAQMWMLNQTRWKEPYYWAGFILQGEWK
jgi:CHAT domain-containing protein